MYFKLWCTPSWGLPVNYLLRQLTLHSFDLQCACFVYVFHCISIVFQLWALPNNYPLQQVTLHPFAVTPPCSNLLMNEALGGSVYYTPIKPNKTPVCLTWSCRNSKGWVTACIWLITSSNKQTLKIGEYKTSRFLFCDGLLAQIFAEIKVKIVSKGSNGVKRDS